MVTSGTRLGDKEGGCGGAGVRMLMVILMGEGVGMRGCGASWCVVFVLFSFFVFGVVRLPSYSSHPLLSVRTPLPSLRIPPFVSPRSLPPLYSHTLPPLPLSRPFVARPILLSVPPFLHCSIPRRFFVSRHFVFVFIRSFSSLFRLGPVSISTLLYAFEADLFCSKRRTRRYSGMKRSRAAEEGRRRRMGEMPLRACGMEGTADVDELETGKWRGFDCMR